MATTTYNSSTTSTSRWGSDKKTGFWIIGALIVLALVLFYAMGDRNAQVNESNPAVYSEPATGVGTSTDMNGTTPVESRDANTATDANVAPKIPDNVE